MNEGTKSLEQYVAQVHTHSQEMERALDVAADAYGIHAGIREMQAAVRSRYGEGHLVLSGEQTIMPLPKNVAKLVAAKALQHISDNVRVLNLRANLDLVGSEGDMYKVWIPSETSQTGYVDMAFMSRARLSKTPGLTAEGALLNDDQLQANVHAFTTGHLKFAYAGSHKVGERIVPDLDARVIDIFRQCYGLLPLGSETTEVHSGLPFPQPISLAQGHENFYSVVQQRLGIVPDLTIYESDLDPYLLRNGGYEVLARIWTSLQNEAIRSGINLSTIKPVQDDSRTPFNMSREGVRLLTIQEGDIVHVLDPRTQSTQESHHISDILREGSEFGVSLRAIPRVMLYSMAGISGHITGGGSVYNRDARELISLIHMPYFPLWNFDSLSSSPIQYVSMASYKSRAKARQNTQATIDFTRAGKASILDCVMSMYPEQAAQEIEDWIELNAGGIRPQSRVHITNKAGQVAEAYAAV